MPPPPDEHPITVHGTRLKPDETRERYREKLARITLDSMAQFVGLLDAQGTVLEINKVALDAVGIALSEVEGRPFWTTFWWQVSPGMNGYEVAGHLCASAAGTSMMLVAITGWGQEEDKRQALAAGFDQHLAKPIDLALLQPVLVRRRELRRR